MCPVRRAHSAAESLSVSAAGGTGARKTRCSSWQAMGEVEADEARRVIAAAVAMAVAMAAAMVLVVVIVAADAAVVACTDAFAVAVAVAVLAAVAAGTWPVVGSAADSCLVLGPGIGSDTAAGLG